MEKLELPGLPEDREKFRSILAKETISDEEFQKCHRVWEDQGMTKFVDYVKYYNNADVIGFVEAVEKMIANEKNNRLDIFKDAISLPGTTGYYTVQEEANGYKKETRYSRESIQWLEHAMRTTGARIRQAGNGGEQRIGNFSVDGYDESTRTVYEYHG